MPRIIDSYTATKVKAVHRYDVVEVRPTGSYAGKKFHFIGAGGVGMSGLAKLLLRNKAIISGSDQSASLVTEQLCSAGAQIRIGHDQQNIDETLEAVVISAAVTDDNPDVDTWMVGNQLYASVTKEPLEVGGDVHTVNKLAILVPWIALAMVIIAGTAMAMRRSRARS